MKRINSLALTAVTSLLTNGFFDPIFCQNVFEFVNDTPE